MQRPPALGSALLSKKKMQAATLMSSNSSNLSKLEEYQRIPLAELELIEEVESIGSKVEESKDDPVTISEDDEDEEEKSSAVRLNFRRCLESDEHPATKNRSSM